MTPSTPAARSTAQPTYPSLAPNVISQQSPPQNPQKVSQYYIDAYSDAALTVLEQALYSEDAEFTKLPVNSRGFVFEATTQKGTKLSLRIFTVEQTLVEPIKVDASLRGINDPTRRIYNLIFQACVAKLPQRHNFGLVLHGLELGVRPDVTPKTLSDFNCNNSQLLKAIVFKVLKEKMKPEHGIAILNGAVRI